MINDTMDNATLLAGFTTYVGSGELDEEYLMAAPALSPTTAILSFIGGSSIQCGMAIGGIVGSIGATIYKGC